MTSALPPNPYAADLGGRDALEALSDTPGRIRALVEGWPPDRFDRSYAPDKWTGREVLIHLAQTELALTARARLALSQEGYRAQAVVQDEWMKAEGRADALAALDAYVALRRFNLAMWTKLSSDERERRFEHPEYGTLSVWWIAQQIAGHDIHHLKAGGNDRVAAALLHTGTAKGLAPLTTLGEQSAAKTRKESQ